MPKRIDSDSLPSTNDILRSLSEFPSDDDDDPAKQLHELVNFFHGQVFGEYKEPEAKEDNNQEAETPKES